MSWSLGGPPSGASDLPTDERLAAYKASPQDRGLETLLFQYGRYLLISSSRPGTLPANLQGKWNLSTNPPWRCDYHSDINLEMNYWPAEPAALAECHLPLFRYLTSLVGVRRINTKEQIHNRQGWAVRDENNIFGAGSYDWCYPANAWYARHFWEHFAFTQDKAFLQAVGYPFIKEVCEFWEERLKSLPDGTLVVPNGWSPEHVRTRTASRSTKSWCTICFPTISKPPPCWESTATTRSGSPRCAPGSPPRRSAAGASFRNG